MRYEFPVKRHRFSTEEFIEKKAKFNAKYGYQMYIPGFWDIVKIDLRNMPTEEETALYKAKKYDELGMARFMEISDIMQEKKDSFLRMMYSPNPTWVNNCGSTMTFLDDVNDSLGTLSMVTRLAASLLPKTAAKALMGPAGWALALADVVNVAMTIARAPITAVMAKSDLSKASTTNPFCKEAKVARAKRLKKIKPDKGQIIEGLQVTKNVFGIGLCLGPVVGAFIEAFTGPYRVLTGKKVDVIWPIPDLSKPEIAAMKGVYGAYMLNTGGQELSSLDHTKTYLVAEMATHVLYPLFQEYHPMDMIDGIENIILPAKQPTDPLTKLLFEQEGVDIAAPTGHLHLDKSDASVSELMDVHNPRIRKSFEEYANNEKHTFLGQLGMQSVNNSTENLLALIEGEDQVELDYVPNAKACFKIIHNDHVMADDTDLMDMKKFAQQIDWLDSRGDIPRWDEIRDTICPSLGIDLIPRPTSPTI